MSSVPLFTVNAYKVTHERSGRSPARVQAIVEVKIKDSFVRRAATGVGPVHALDNALRECLRSDFPELETVRLSDYRVGVVDAASGTGAQVRVLIEATDGRATWNAGCTSSNVLEASFEALCSAALIGIMRARAATERPPSFAM
jgi:2-isopropylmalate synthase